MLREIEDKFNLAEKLIKLYRLGFVDDYHTFKFWDIKSQTIISVNITLEDKDYLGDDAELNYNKFDYLIQSLNDNILLLSIKIYTNEPKKFLCAYLSSFPLTYSNKEIGYIIDGYYYYFNKQTILEIIPINDSVVVSFNDHLKHILSNYRKIGDFKHSKDNLSVDLINILVEYPEVPWDQIHPNSQYYVEYINGRIKYQMKDSVNEKSIIGVEYPKFLLCLTIILLTILIYNYYG